MIRARRSFWLLLAATALLAPACGGDLIIRPGGDDDDDDGPPGPQDDGGGWDLGDDTGETGGTGDGGTGDGGTGDEGGSDSGAPLVIAYGDLVISEIMIDSSAVSDAEGEWIEIWNASDQAIPLSAIAIADEGVDFLPIDSSATIRPGQYAVLCAESSTAVNGGVSCDAGYHYNTYGDGFSLSNSGDEAILATLDGEIIDWMAYTDSQVTPGAALGVRPASLDADDNDVASAWCTQTKALSGGDQGTPGQQNDGC